MAAIGARGVFGVVLWCTVLHPNMTWGGGTKCDDRLGSTSKNIFIFGEVHGAEGNVEYLKPAINQLLKRGVRNLALELPVDARQSFGQAVAGSLSGVERGASVIAKNGTRLMGLGDLMELTSYAQGLGMNVYCVDKPRDPKFRETRMILAAEHRLARGSISEREFVRQLQRQFSKRNKHMAAEIEKIPGDTILITGMFHTGGPDSIEEHLRKRGMRTVTVDMYPSKQRPAAVDIFSRVLVEEGKFSVRVGTKQSKNGPSEAKIEAMIRSVEHGGVNQRGQ